MATAEVAVQKLILTKIVEVYDRSRADWMPTQELRALLAEAGEKISLADLSRLMRDHNQSITYQEYDNRRRPGYHKKQFLDTLGVFLEQERAEDEAKQEHDLDTCAMRVLDWIAGMDPDWNLRIQAIIDERQFDAKQVLASLAGWVLDNRMHMSVPKNDRLMGASWTHDTQECCMCGRPFRMSYPGQPCCLNPGCGKMYHDLQRTTSDGIPSGESGVDPPLVSFGREDPGDEYQGVDADIATES